MKKTALLSVLLTLAACDPYGGTTRPDYAIRVTPTPTGGVAQAPVCPSWTTERFDPLDNALFPQYGCANARNLAAMVERPDDLIDARPLGPERGVIAVGAMRRYDNNQTRGLIVPGSEVNTVAATSSSSATSPMTGDITGGTSGGGSSSSSSSATSP
ncbi:MAG: CpaD family pilus assembly lipoprotein [Alphaproteobacteria bacterium]|nr:CpaD family pilus assembly lipoprotein [Alphaproteobacteria bacterium]